MAWFNYFMEKEPCTKFCGVLISSHEVMKLQVYHWFHLHIFVIFMKKNFLHSLWSF